MYKKTEIVETDMTTFSEYFNLNKSQAELDFVNITFLNA